MLNLVNLENKKILVVGASQGIGAQVALTLGNLGAQLILAARNEEKLKHVKKEMGGGKKHICYSMDVKQLEQIENSVKDIVYITGPLDGMVYCAGVSDDRPLAMARPSVVEEILKTNLHGFIELVRCVTKEKNFNTGMRIVGISSTSSFRGSKAHAIYSASKAGMDGAVRSMAAELAEKGICINTVAPSFIKTEMYEKVFNGLGREMIENKMKRQYLGLGMPEDIANAVAFLISPAARYITGNCLPVDGGILTN